MKWEDNDFFIFCAVWLSAFVIILVIAAIVDKCLK